MNERLLVAVRALICINNRQHADPQDIATLRGWVDPKDSAADNDELARIIIETEISRKKEISLRLVKRAAA